MTPSVDISNSALTTQLITVVNSAGNTTPAVDINTEGKFVITWEKNSDTYFRIFTSDGGYSSSQVKTNLADARYQSVAIKKLEIL